MSRHSSVIGLRAIAIASVVLVAAAAAPEAAVAGDAPLSGEWIFRVLLDDRAIGEHRFTVRADGADTRVASDARFDVALLGFSVYRYRHQAAESWRDSCLVSLASTTDDDGTASKVRLVGKGPRQQTIETAKGSESVEGCLMSFAYWHPALRVQTRLLNVQSGKIEQVQVRRVADARIDVRGQTLAATGFRVSGAAHPIDVWYSAEGDWIGLDAVVDGGRRLSYRLR
jgi:hypothetical protein